MIRTEGYRAFRTPQSCFVPSVLPSSHTMISEVRASSDCQRVSSSMHGSRKLAPLYTGTSMLSIMDDDSMVGVALCCQAPGPPTIRSRLLLLRSRWYSLVYR